MLIQDAKPSFYYYVTQKDKYAIGDNRFQKIFTCSPEAMGIIDSMLKITEVNQAACELFRCEAGDLSGKDILELVFEEDRHLVSGLRQQLDNDGIIRNAEVRLTRKSGEVFTGSFSAYVIYGRQGTPAEYISLIRDITLEKQIEKELKEAKQHAEEADCLKTAFLANMSHEIRTPMNAIIGFSELLTDPDLSREELDNYTKIIKNRCTHLLQIVNDILDISRIEANQIELKENPVNLNHLLDELYLYYAQKLVDEKKFRLALNVEKMLDDEESAILVDELRLRQVIGNLLDNAVKFTSEGTIGYGYRIVQNMVLFHVTDTGIGIPEEKHEIIFQRFRQIDTSLSRQFGGNGLGLAICKAFVELMGGQIWLESETGKGSAFYFTVPLKREVSMVPNAEPRSGSMNFDWRDRRILLVEDDRQSAGFIRELFRLTRVELIIASNAEEALRIFSDGDEFDLVLMDIQLPDRNGLELARLFKGINRNIPVIAQTAYAMEGDNIKCIQAGCDDYISKPLNISELLGMIDGFLSER